MTWVIICAVLFGALTVALSSHLDFHKPYRISEIRYASLRERYLLAIAIYVTTALVLYGVIGYTLWLALLFAPDCANPPKTLSGMIERPEEQPSLLARLALAIPATTFILLIAPRIFPLRTLADGFRRLVQQAFARFPQSVEIITALIQRAPFKISSQARSEVVRELDRYGVPSELIDTALAGHGKVLSLAAAERLQEFARFTFASEKHKRPGGFKGSSLPVDLPSSNLRMNIGGSCAARRAPCFSPSFRCSVSWPTSSYWRFPTSWRKRAIPCAPRFTVCWLNLQCPHCRPGCTNQSHIKLRRRYPS